MAINVTKSEWEIVNKKFAQYIKENGKPPPSGWKLDRSKFVKQTNGTDALSHSFMCFLVKGQPQLFALDHQHKNPNIEKRYLGAGFQSESVKLVVNQEGEYFALKTIELNECKAKNPPYYNIDEQKKAFLREFTFLSQMGYGYDAIILNKASKTGRVEKGYILQKAFIGGTLSEVEQQTFCSAINLELALSFCSEFGKMKQLGIIHADLKPQNVMFYKDSTNKNTFNTSIIDYGTAVNRELLEESNFLWKVNGHHETIFSLEFTDFSCLLMMLTIFCSPYLFDDMNRAFTEELLLKFNSLRDLIELFDKFNTTDSSQVISPNSSDEFYSLYPRLLYKFLDEFSNYINEELINEHKTREAEKRRNEVTEITDELMPTLKTQKGIKQQLMALKVDKEEHISINMSQL